MKILTCTLGLSLCLVSAHPALAGDDAVRFSSTILKEVWASHYEHTASCELIRFSPVFQSPQSQVQVEWILARYPDGLARNTRIFPLPQGVTVASPKIVDAMLPGWHDAGGHLDMHWVPGTNQQLLRQGPTNEYVAFQQSRDVFTKSNDGFMPHLVAHTLLEVDPWVILTDEGLAWRMHVREWGTTFWIEPAHPLPRIVRTQNEKPSGEWGLREEYSDFRVVKGYPGEVPFRAQVFENSGAWTDQEGVTHPAGPRERLVWQLHSFVAREIKTEEFQPTGDGTSPVRLTQFTPSMGRIISKTGGTVSDHSQRAGTGHDPVPSSTSYAIPLRSWIYGGGAVAVIAAYALWMWMRRR